MSEQIGHDHATARRRADKLAVACIDSHMRRTRFIRFKKYQIAGLQSFDRHRPSHRELSIRHTGQIDPDIGKNITREAGAVEPSGSRPAKPVRNADVLEAGLQQTPDCRDRGAAADRQVPSHQSFE